jgi:hypothetical protein
MVNSDPDDTYLCILPMCLTFTNTDICPHSVSSTIYNIDRLVGVMYMARVCCQVENEVPNNI